MNAGDYLDAALKHADIMESKEYRTREEVQRDMAIGIELAQRYADALLETIESLDTDYIPMSLED
jgi:hypothetical protein